MNKKLISYVSTLLLAGNIANFIPKALSNHLSVYAATAAAATASKSTAKTASKTTTVKNKKYKDGVFTGSAQGFRNIIEVQVTLKSDKITAVKVTSINDTRRFYTLPLQIIPGEIVKAQSTNVDTVSGATYSSEGIINAVAAALKKAKI